MTALSPAEIGSLKEIGRGAYHAPVPKPHAENLLDLKLVYQLLGDLRITTAGRLYLQQGR
jgi:hypothetical protein